MRGCLYCCCCSTVPILPRPAEVQVFAATGQPMETVIGAVADPTRIAGDIVNGCARRPLLRPPRHQPDGPLARLYVLPRTSAAVLSTPQVVSPTLNAAEAAGMTQTRAPPMATSTWRLLPPTSRLWFLVPIKLGLGANSIGCAVYVWDAATARELPPALGPRPPP